MRIRFYGAAQTVTGSCHMVEANGRRVLVDCGLFQGSKALQERNYGQFPFSPDEIDAVLVTHAHIDHTGLLPKLTKMGWRGPIYATSPTRDLCSVMLPDSAYIQEMEVERKNRKLARQGKSLLQPIYTVDDATRCLLQFKQVEYHHPFAAVPGINVTFLPAGHILGSAILHIEARGNGNASTSVVFSGDLGPPDRPIVPDPEPPGSADYIVMESTYGDRHREAEEDEFPLLAKIIADTFARGGNVIIPAFAIERTQNILYGLNRLVHQGTLAPGQIYVDSPLAVEATEIFARHVDLFDEEAQRFRKVAGDIPLYFPNLRLVRTVQESMALNKIKKGAVIISASGMCEAGRIKHHLKHNLWRPECSVVFVGYQAMGTLGRRILDGEPVVRIHGEEVRVKAAIHHLKGFSAHAHQEDLVAWASSFTSPPRGIFLVHGEESALTALQAILRAKLQVPVEIPAPLAQFELEEKPAEVESGQVVGAADVLSPSLWGATRRLLAALHELERADLSQQEMTSVLSELEALRARLDATARRRGAA